MAAAQGFPRRYRLTESADFTRLLRCAPRAADAHVALWAAPNDLPHSRFGLMVGRKHGNAVQRNAYKRRLREAFRIARDELPAGFDVLCSPHPGAIISVNSAIESIRALMQKLARRAARQ